MARNEGQNSIPASKPRRKSGSMGFRNPARRLMCSPFWKNFGKSRPDDDVVGAETYRLNMTRTKILIVWRHQSPSKRKLFSICSDLRSLLQLRPPYLTYLRLSEGSLRRPCELLVPSGDNMEFPCVWPVHAPQSYSPVRCTVR